MTVSTVVDHNDYTGNGVTTSFPYTFRIFKKTDLSVSIIDLSENITVLALDTDYTVTNAGGYNGGNVVLTTPLTNGWQISIARELEPTQETDLRNQGKFFAEVHEDAFDKLTMLIQQVGSMFRLALRKPSSIAYWYDALNNYIRNLRDPRDPQDAATKNYVDTLASGNFSRTLRVPEPIPQLPDAATRANKMPAFDSAGNPIVVIPPSGSASDVLIELAKPDGEKNIGECQTIAQLRTIEPTYDRQRITLREHTAGTRKGGGQFRAVLSGGTYTDNNGTIIKTTGGAAWLRINAEIVNPLMFGALGDGVTNDSIALNSAGTYATRVIDLLGLTYGVGSTWFLDSATPKVVKNGGLKYLTSLGTSTMMRYKNAAHEMYNVDFDGGGSTTSTGLIWEGGNVLRGGVVQDCNFRYTGGSGIVVSYDGTNNTVGSFGVIKRVTFNRCGLTGVANGRCCLLLDGVTNFTVSDIVATDCNWGIYMRNDMNNSSLSRASNNTISRVNLKGQGLDNASYPDAQGISCSYQDNLQISDVTVDGFPGNGIDMQYCDASIVTNWRATSCGDGVFMGDRACRRHTISNGVAVDCNRAIRLITDGTYTMNSVAPALAHIKIANVHAYNSRGQAFYLVNSGRVAYGSSMTNVQLDNCSVDGTGSLSRTTQTHGFHIEGGVNVTLMNCNTFNIRQHGVYIKDSEFVRILGGTHQNVDQIGAGNQGVYVSSDCNRVSISDVSVYGYVTAGAVTLAGGGGHSAKHIRWRGVANGVTSSGATSPYLFDNTSF
ncbi:hypothetical protein ACUN97_001265 [Enterobacter kobei]